MPDGAYHTPEHVLHYAARQVGVAESEALVGSEDASRLPNVDPEVLRRDAP